MATSGLVTVCPSGQIEHTVVLEALVGGLDGRSRLMGASVGGSSVSEIGL